MGQRRDVGHRWIRVVGLIALLPGAVCETQEVTSFGEPSRVTTSGEAAANSSASGGGCNIDSACKGVTWTTNIFKNLINSTGGKQPGGGCTANNCHGGTSANGKLTLDATNADASYLALRAYKLTAFGNTPYIDPCHPENSGIICNLNWSTEANFKKIWPSGACGGPPMPYTSGHNTPVHSQLSQSELNDLVGWITCGAPKN